MFTLLKSLFATSNERHLELMLYHQREADFHAHAGRFADKQWHMGQAMKHSRLISWPVDTAQTE